jgi:hypothetical protein
MAPPKWVRIYKFSRIGVPEWNRQNAYSMGKV